MKTYFILSVSIFLSATTIGCGKAANNETDSSLGLVHWLESARTQVSDLEENPTLAEPYACGNNGTLICHFPPGNSKKKKALCIGSAAIQHHIKEHKRGDFGDYLGMCVPSEGGGTDTGGGTGSGGGDVEQVIDCTDPANRLNSMCL